MRQHFAARGQDLLDSFEVVAGVGAPAYGSVRLTDYAVVGLGFAAVQRFGWRGRYGGGLDLPYELNEAEIDFGIPLMLNHEGEGHPFDMWPGDTTSVFTVAPWKTSRLYPDPPGPRAATAGRFWVALSATLGASGRVGFNPVEFADFVVGWLGWDLLQDDSPHWGSSGGGSARSGRYLHLTPPSLALPQRGRGGRRSSLITRHE